MALASGTIITEANRAEWLAQRSQSLGASEAAAALGVSPWMAPVDLWQRKLGLVGGVEENEAMRWGNILEPVIIEEYQRRTGAEVERCQLYVEGDEPWMTATLDGMALRSGRYRVVEVKTASAHSDGWGEPGTDVIPDHYRVQVMHQLAIMGGCAGADVAALIGGQDLRIYHIERDDALIAQIVEGERLFWDHVQRREPPTWGKLDSRILAILNPECHGHVELDFEALNRLDEYDELRGRMKRDKKRCEELKVEILKTLGNARHGLEKGEPRVQRYLTEVAERTQTVNAYKRHYFSSLKAKGLE